MKGRLAACAAGTMATLLLMSGCSLGSPVANSTWKGGNFMDTGVTITFDSGDGCQLRTSFRGSGPCKYEVSGSQVSIIFGGQRYTFDTDGKRMVGVLFGAGVDLSKQ